MQYARDIRAGLENATYDDKRRMLENLRVRVTVKGGQIVGITGLIEFYTMSNATNAGAAFESLLPAVSRSTL
jgi:hypothetical protein